VADYADVRRIALSLPGAVESRNGDAFAVVNRGKAQEFVWVWLERVEPKKARVPNYGFIGVRVPSNEDKLALIRIHPERLFTEPHYNGYPAVLVRLGEVSAEELRGLLVDGWRCRASKTLQHRLDDADGE
jgi:hypothetical protein